MAVIRNRTRQAANASYGFSPKFFEVDKCKEAANTAYAIEQGAHTSESADYAGNGDWWLRSPGSWSGYPAHVGTEGYNYYNSVFAGYRGNGVRPALRVDLTSAYVTYAGTVSSDGTVKEASGPQVIPISAASISAVQAQTYTGKAIKPVPAISRGSKALVAGKDFTCAYKNNVNAGKAMITFTGKGKYKGKATRTFTIKKQQLSAKRVSLARESFTFGGREGLHGKMEETGCPDHRLSASIFDEQRLQEECQNDNHRK